MDTNPRPGFSSRAHGDTVGRIAKVKSLEPITSTRAPRFARVMECSQKGIMLRVRRYMTVGTVVQVRIEGEFSLGKVFCCISDGDGFQIGVEPVEAFSA